MRRHGLGTIDDQDRSSASERRVKSTRSRRTFWRQEIGYLRAHVAHYWLVDPEQQTLTVLAWAEDGYQTILTAGRGGHVCAEPFAERELDLGWVVRF
ncbi:MAG: Uma2 family endonuclease [Proteobacteria bacterium]|nr:Uma2 family endonuclease [Pseudomonadota bacterium]